jgi:uncharacterized integral membrane protein
MANLASQSRDMDISLADAAIIKKKRGITTNVRETFLGASSSSLLAQEKDTRIQFESNYTFYTVWLIIAIILLVIMFSNFFYTPSSSESSSFGSGGDESSSSYGLAFGIIALLLFIYFIIQFMLARFNISRPQLPFSSINPLFVL